MTKPATKVAKRQREKKDSLNVNNADLWIYGYNLWTPKYLLIKLNNKQNEIWVFIFSCRQTKYRNVLRCSSSFRWLYINQIGLFWKRLHFHCLNKRIHSNFFSNARQWLLLDFQWKYLLFSYSFIRSLRLFLYIYFFGERGWCVVYANNTISYVQKIRFFFPFSLCLPIKLSSFKMWSVLFECSRDTNLQAVYWSANDAIQYEGI